MTSTHSHSPTGASQTCPEKNTFVEFLSGKLEDEQLQRLEKHLANCSACGDTVRAMNVEDTFVHMVERNDSLKNESDGDGPELASLMHKLESLADSRVGTTEHGADVDLTARRHEVESLLSPPLGEEIGRLGDYRLLRPLGAGGMGMVYQAEDTKLQRLVALKILRPSLGPLARERFIQEARAAAAIEHDNVVTIYNVGTEGQLAFLAMQWIEGETLEDRLKRKGKLSSDEVIELGSQIADGLAAAHAKKLIHRDIKPANIWLESDRNRARILDFGLARCIDDDVMLTETGMIAGTPAYMSPEQAQGRAIDERSDLFSLGSMLYRMLTGSLPFEADNALATIVAIQRDTPPAPRQIDIETTLSVSDITMDLLEKDPRDRPPTAKLVASSLRTGERQYPVVERTGSHSAAVQPKLAASRFWNGGRLLAFLAAFGLGGLIAAPMIYRIATDRGTLTIKTESEDVKVEVLEGGDLYRVIDTSTKDTITLRSGDYTLQLADPASEFELNKSQVTLKRDGEVVVTVSGATGDAAVAGRFPTEANSTEDLVPTSSELIIHDPNRPVKPGDRLRVEPVSADLLPRDVVVQADFSIRLPYVGTVDCEGKSILKLAEALSQEYEGIVRNPSTILVSYADPGAPIGRKTLFADPSKPLRPGDRLRLEHVNQNNVQLNRSFEVMSSTTVLVPWLGSVNVKGMTIDELRDKLGELLAEKKIIRNDRHNHLLVTYLYQSKGPMDPAIERRSLSGGYLQSYSDVANPLELPVQSANVKQRLAKLQLELEERREQLEKEVGEWEAEIAKLTKDKDAGTEEDLFPPDVAVIGGFDDDLFGGPENRIVRLRRSEIESTRSKLKSLEALLAALANSEKPLPGSRIIQSGSRIHVNVAPWIDGDFQVEPTGLVPLGSKHGRVNVGGLTFEQAEVFISKKVLGDIYPRTQVTAPAAVQGQASGNGGSVSGDSVGVPVQTLNAWEQLADLRKTMEERRASLKKEVERLEAKNANGETADGLGFGGGMGGELPYAKQRLNEVEERLEELAACTQLVPGSQMIQPGSRITVKVSGATINGEFLVEPTGMVPLGASFGRAKVAGLSYEQAEIVISNEVFGDNRYPATQVTAPAGAQGSVSTGGANANAGDLDAYVMSDLVVTTPVQPASVKDRLAALGLEMEETRESLIRQVKDWETQIVELEKKDPSKDAEATPFGDPFELRDGVIFVQKKQESLEKLLDAFATHAEPAAGSRIVRPSSRINVRVSQTTIKGDYFVEPSGAVPLGPEFGRFNVGGLTYEQAEILISYKLFGKDSFLPTQVTGAIPQDAGTE